jgi:hypothetical protein
MPDEPKILNAGQKASIRLFNQTTAFSTLREAFEYWQSLSSAKREHASLVTEDGRLYQPFEIELIKLSETSDDQST